VILAECSRSLERRVLTIGEEVESRYAAGLAVKVTSPAQMEVLGARGTPLWQLLEEGIPLLAAPGTPRKALPAPGRPALPAPRPRGPVRTLTRDRAREKMRSQLHSASTLLESGQHADAVSLAYAALRRLAKAWLPTESLNGRRESELVKALLRELPGGRRGEWGQRVSAAKRLRDDLELGCQELQDPAAAEAMVADVRALGEELLETRAEGEPPEAEASAEPEGA